MEIITFRLLVENKEAGDFISVVRSDDRSTIMAYVPRPTTVKFYNLSSISYQGQWFDPARNTYAPATLSVKNGVLEATSAGDGDRVLVLRRK